MNSKSPLFLILILLCFNSFSQNMDTGFQYLESGEFAQAETFFSNILEQFPDNKTAKLCYGRAVGLNGNPQKA